MRIVRDVFRRDPKTGLGRSYYEWRCEGSLETGHQARYAYTRGKLNRYRIERQDGRAHQMHDTIGEVVGYLRTVRDTSNPVQVRDNMTKQWIKVPREEDA